jgi:hypothetical protein
MLSRMRSVVCWAAATAEPQSPPAAAAASQLVPVVSPLAVFLFLLTAGIFSFLLPLRFKILCVEHCIILPKLLEKIKNAQVS